MVLLPEGGELTLAELREVAARQQQQIEAQQQILVAKEQRLKFLKQQEARHHQGSRAVEVEILRQLRENVETQELKLRRLRAVQGQVEQQQGKELESIQTLFSEKEKELSLAIAKVEDLASQLEDLRRTSRMHTAPTASSTAMDELEKLRQELVYRTMLTEQQNACIARQRDLLAKKQQEISFMDLKILELQHRLQRKCLLNKQLATQLHLVSTVRHIASTPCQTRQRRLATVEPLQRPSKDDLHVNSETEDLAEFTPSKNDPKYQTLPYNTKFLMKGAKEQEGDESTDGEDWSPVADKEFVTPVDRSEPDTLQSNSPSCNLANFTPRPFGSTYSSSLLGPLTTRSQQSPNNNGSSRTQTSTPSLMSSVSVAYSSSSSENLSISKVHPCLGSSANEPDELQSEDVKMNELPTSTTIEKAKKDLQELYVSTSQEIQANYKPAVPPKPLIPSKPIPPPRQIHLAGSSLSCQERNDVNMALSVLRSSGSERYKFHNRFHSKLGPLTNVKNKPAFNHPSDISCQDSEGNHEDAERRQSPIQLPIRPKPLTIRKSPGLEPPRLKANQAAIAELVKCKGSSLISKWPSDSTDKHLSSTDNNNFYQIEIPSVFLHSEDCTEDGRSDKKRQKHDATDKEAMETEGNKPCTFIDKQPPYLEDEQDGFHRNIPQTQDTAETKTERENNQLVSAQLPGGADSTDAEEAKKCSLPAHQSAAIRRVKKGNLKTSGSCKSPRRVSFDPLALLLDAALEGELELVKKTTLEVPNPSAANDEGITALHNAICAGHFEIVTFLVEFGCDVNAQDSDGWTPLHCAASCNNLPMVKFLAEHGACIFATTLSDHETAAEKCEEDEEGFDGCSEYLYSMQEKLGVLNNSVVYAVYDYEAQNADELSFQDGCSMTVLRKGDDQEREWWWAQVNDHQGYIPRNLLGLYPRVNQKKEG